MNDPLEEPLFARLVELIQPGQEEPFALAEGAEAELEGLLLARRQAPELPRLVLGLLSVAHSYHAERACPRLAERLVSLVGALAPKLGLLDAEGRALLGLDSERPAWARGELRAPHVEDRAPEGSVKAATLVPPRRILR